MASAKRMTTNMGNAYRSIKMMFEEEVNIKQVLWALP
jgi:diacylglycerol kinase